MRVLGLALLATAAAAGAAAPPANAGHAAAVKPRQQLAALLRSHKVVRSLHAPRARASTVHARRPITGGQTVLPIVGHATTKDGARWLRVMLPGRPNGRRGWIARKGTMVTSTSWHLVVRTRKRQARVYRRGRLVRRFAAIVGKPSTPTPRGHFFVEESIRLPAGSPGAPFALASSARSDVLQEFEGGPGQIALHGVGNLGGTLGTAVSHGCVRLANPSIRWLAARIAPGAPITVRR